MKKRKGFAIMELMIIVVILGIVAAIALPTYRGYVQEQNFKETYARSSYGNCHSSYADHMYLKWVCTPEEQNAAQEVVKHLHPNVETFTVTYQTDTETVIYIRPLTKSEE